MTDNKLDEALKLRDQIDMFRTAIDRVTTENIGFNIAIVDGVVRVDVCGRYIKIDGVYELYRAVKQSLTDKLQELEAKYEAL